jgi:uncharacterized delta-60 repeat protein
MRRSNCVPRIEPLEVRRLLSVDPLDATFGGNGVAYGLPPTSTAVLATSIGLESDGKIVVGITGEGGAPLVRYNTDGSLDTSFGHGGYALPTPQPLVIARALAIQRDGKIIVAGSTAAQQAFAVARYNSDGTPDMGFGTGGIVVTDIPPPMYRGGEPIFALALALQTDGRIVVGGTDGGYWALARYDSDGTLDPAFGTSGIFLPGINGDAATNEPTSLHSIALQPDGKIVAAGETEDIHGVSNAVARFLPDGSLDPAFGSGGLSVLPTPNIGGLQIITSAVVTLPNGELMLGGNQNDGDFTLWRIESDGSLDNSFGNNGKLESPAIGGGISAMALRQDGTLIAAGGTATFSSAGITRHVALAAYRPDGSLDASFGTGGIIISGVNAAARGIAIQSDGKVVVVATDGRQAVVARYFGAPVFGVISGQVFDDVNNNGAMDSGEGGVSGVLVYIDRFNGGTFQSGDPNTRTDSVGDFTFALVPGTYTIREVVPAGFRQSSPLGYSWNVSVSTGETVSSVGFGDVPTFAVMMDFRYLLTLAQSFGHTGTFATGDVNDDGHVDLTDLLIVARNFGHVLPPSV